ncbi:MAG TPA: alpha-L-arabinofuranosidase C-terminal domain-containing protein, partial [Terriglobia bacterium]|nr:alpha-L-arabinofuranosidase C-terminal domain-containing protein [Terriglobia bacterium]
DLERAKSLPPDAPTDNAYVKVDQTPLEWARYAANVVHRKAEEWEGYQQRFPAMLDKKIFLSIDEYAYFGGGFGRGVNLKLALAYGMLFNEMLRHTGFLTMSAHTMGVSTLDYNSTAAALNTTGLVFKLYGDQMGAGMLPVAVSGDSPQPAPQFPIGGDQPKTNSGSPTYPLDMVAALTPDRKYLDIAVVNATETEQRFDLNVSGARLEGPVKMWQVTGKDLEAANHVGQLPQVEVKEIAIGDAPHSLTVAPISVNIFRVPLGGGAK